MKDKYCVVSYPHEIKFIDKNGGTISYYVDRKVSDYVKELQDKLSKIESENMQLQSNWNSLREINNEAREYLTSYEAISTIQGLDNIEKNKQLDENTINEMTNRYLKVHHKLLSILDKMNELEVKDK